MNQSDLIGESKQTVRETMETITTQELAALDLLEIWTPENVAGRFNKSIDWAQRTMKKAGSAKIGGQVIERSRFMDYIRSQYRNSETEARQAAINMNARRKTA